MTHRLVNVRLDPDRLEKARRLREDGLTLSDLVREAIDRRYEQLVGSRKRSNADAIMAGIYEEHPDPPDLPPRDYDVHVADEARQAVRHKLRNTRS